MPLFATSLCIITLRNALRLSAGKYSPIMILCSAFFAVNFTTKPSFVQGEDVAAMLLGNNQKVTPVPEETVGSAGDWLLNTTAFKVLYFAINDPLCIWVSSSFLVSFGCF